LAKQKRSAREIAEAISAKVLEKIHRKTTAFEKADAKGDRDAMLDNQLTDEEWHFVQAQQKLDQDADEIDHAAGLLDDMDNKELQELFEQLKPQQN